MFLKKHIHTFQPVFKNYLIMKQVFNFNAGPAILPQEVLQQAAESVRDFSNSGLSILEISHRSKDFEAVVNEAVTLVKELLNVPDGYSVLFLQGGASLQFSMVPYNLLDEGDTAAYLETGVWAKKALKEAKLFGNVNVVASSGDKNYNYIPKNYSVPTDSKYFHITSNNTIFGTQIHKFPESQAPLIADMSSDIFSHPVSAGKFALIYAGAQKNLGPAGVTLVILRNDILGKIKRAIPTMLNYKTHIDENSLFNTPSVYAIYVCLLTLRWLKSQGGLTAMEKRNYEKQALLYKEIDNNPNFSGTAVKEDRSWMNVTFVAKEPAIEEKMLKLAKEANLIGLKGHRSVGGFRASLYNAMSLEGVQRLVEVMRGV